MEAYDLDGSSPNNEIVYRIQSGAQDKFVIDALSGLISISEGANLDPDFTSPKSYSYLLELAALDGGLGSSKLSGFATVNVTIEDVNNKPPVFKQQLLSLSLKENVKSGFFLTKIVAADPDKTSKLRYSIVWDKSKLISENGRHLTRSSSNLKVDPLFELESVSGDIRVIGDIDREFVEVIELAIMVEDISAPSSTKQRAEMLVLITVIDENDNNPQFEKPFYVASLPENSAVGYGVVSVLAHDIDKNRTIQYSLEGGSPQQWNTLEYVDLNIETGEVKVRSKADREIITWFNFTVRATDSGFPPRSDFVDVFVQIMDENDNSPIFGPESMKQGGQNISVREDTKPGTVISTIFAHDADEGEYGKVTYFLDQRSALDKFHINPETGDLSVSKWLDREEESTYNLIVQAYDNYQFGFTTGQSRNAFAQITVHVTDINDEAPVFNNINEEDGTSRTSTSNEHCSALVTEFHEITESILSVRATDKDDPRSENAHLSFTIQAGNELGLFRIEKAGRTSSRIFPNRQLKGYYGNYTLLIEARDKGIPPNAATADYVICVQVLYLIYFRVECCSLYYILKNYIYFRPSEKCVSRHILVSR